jgi:hypothetical protein
MSLAGRLPEAPGALYLPVNASTDTIASLSRPVAYGTSVA